MGHLALLVALAAVLSGCENAPNPFAKKDNPENAPITTDAAQSVRLVDRDVEAPEVFQTTDTALWDGRPSLGGVWVASPDAVNPERVILRNEANGKFVIGALFRRERDNPGPKLQISSDAAEALGMLAGQPGALNVVALRREDSKAAKATPAAAAASETEIGDVEAVPVEPPVDPIAAAGAALDDADAGATVDAAAVAAPSDDLDPTPRPGETKRAARQRARAAAKAAAAAAAVAAAVDGDFAVAAPVPELDVAPLPDLAAEVEPAAPAAPTGGPIRIQIGIFSVEANAQLAVDKLNAAGIDATIRKDESKGKAYWSVVANGSGDRDALLAKVKGLGFVDAYSVSG